MLLFVYFSFMPITISRNLIQTQEWWTTNRHFFWWDINRVKADEQTEKCFFLLHPNKVGKIWKIIRQQHDNKKYTTFSYKVTETGWEGDDETSRITEHCRQRGAFVCTSSQLFSRSFTLPFTLLFLLTHKSHCKFIILLSLVWLLWGWKGSLW